MGIFHILIHPFTTYKFIVFTPVMNLQLRKTLDPLIKITTWILNLIAWTCLYTADDYSKFAWSPYSPTLMIILAHFTFLCLWIPFSMFASYKNESVVGNS